MLAIKAIVLISTIIFANSTLTATITSSMDTFTTFSTNCLGTNWGGANINCFNNKLAGYQCCATTTTISVFGFNDVSTSCSVRDLSSTASNTGSGGIAGLASASVTQACSGVNMKVVFAMLAICLMMLFN